jgi:hypothetical protein
MSTKSMRVWCDSRFGRQRADHGAQVGAVHALHGEEQAPVFADADLVHGHDVRVLELTGDARLAHERQQRARVVHALVDGLAGHQALEAGVAHLRHLAHAAGRQVAAVHQALRGGAGDGGDQLVDLGDLTRHGHPTERVGVRDGARLPHGVRVGTSRGWRGGTHVLGRL